MASTRKDLQASTAHATLTVSYGMTRLGADRALSAARRDGQARTGALEITCNGRYGIDERFEITDHR